MKRLVFSLILTIFILFPAYSYSQTPAIPTGEIVIDEAKFRVWLAAFKDEAIQKGVSQSMADKALEGIRPIKRIIELDRKQPEFTKTFQEYMQSVVPKSRIEKGRMKMKENEALLDAVSEKYGVPKRFIVALWGIETDFGEKAGTYYIPEALATLAFEGRRHEFFRKELLNALMILEARHIKPKQMIGSWAGAMGQTQFMPSSYLSWAVDYNNDGKADIWKTREDVFASIANYLSNAGWNKESGWGRKVKLPLNFDVALAGVQPEKKKDIKEWQRLGVRRLDGLDLPDQTLDAWIVLPDKTEKHAYLVYTNYQSILKWNRSDYFATAVGHLSDALRRDDKGNQLE